MMQTYHKIQTVFDRDPQNKHKTLLWGQFARPEFEYLADNTWSFTEKVDGTNIRVSAGAGAGSVVFGGRTDNAQIPAFLLKKLDDIFMPIALADRFPVGVILFGEGYGAKIQRVGAEYRPDNGFVLFDVYIDGWWLRRENVEAVAHDLGLEVVPIVGEGTLWDMAEMAKTGFKSQLGNLIAEGIVATPTVEMYSRAGQRIITKIKHKDFF
jgi:hypothetical protein